MKLVEFEGYKGMKMSIVAEHIQGISDKGGNQTNIIVARLTEDVDDYFIVDEPYEKVKEKLEGIVLDKS